MRDFLGNAATILLYFAFVALGVAVGWWGTWLSVAILTLAWSLLGHKLWSKYYSETASSQWWEIWYAAVAMATLLCWLVAVIVVPLVHFVKTSAVSISTDQFFR